MLFRVVWKQQKKIKIKISTLWNHTIKSRIPKINYMSDKMLGISPFILIPTAVILFWRWHFGRCKSFDVMCWLLIPFHTFTARDVPTSARFWYFNFNHHCPDGVAVSAVYYNNIIYLGVQLNKSYFTAKAPALKQIQSLIYSDANSK